MFVLGNEEATVFIGRAGLTERLPSAMTFATVKEANDFVRKARVGSNCMHVHQVSIELVR